MWLYLSATMSTGGGRSLRPLNEEVHVDELPAPVSSFLFGGLMILRYSQNDNHF